jgi:hypothetical protein
VGAAGELSGKIALIGYDAVRTDEKPLNLTAKVTYDATKKISLTADLDSSTPWEKPFGLTGTKISVLSLAMEGTYKPFTFKKVDFTSTLESDGTNTGIAKLLKIDRVEVKINIDAATKKTTLNGTLVGEIPLLPKVGDFSVDLKGANLKVEKIGENYTTDISGEIALKGYDPTRSGETPLLLNGSVSVKEKTLSLSASLDPTTVWINPFGLSGSKITVLSLKAESSIDPFEFKKLDFDATLESDRTTKGIFNALKIDSVKVAINIDSEMDTTTLNGALVGEIPLLPKVGDFSVDLTEANLKVEKTDGVYSTDVSGKITLKGYDPMSSNEKPLILIGSVTVKDKALLNASLDSSTVWINPFGLTGSKITVLSLNAESSIDPFEFKKLDFKATLESDRIVVPEKQTAD